LHLWIVLLSLKMFNLLIKSYQILTQVYW